MQRRQLIEIEDLAWCPRAVRDGGTDWLAFVANATKAFALAAPKIRAALDATGSSTVIDLCSGGGGPWLTLEPELAKSGQVHVELSDLFPNVAALGALRARSGNRIAFRGSPVDATDVPAEFDGVRTMFNSFHHFPPDRARAILGDAVRKRRGIAIFEWVTHRAIGVVGIPLLLPAVLLLTPFVRPFRWSRLLFTYALPLIPCLVLFDGTVSMLRVYLQDELRELVAGTPDHEGFSWDIGTTMMAGVPGGLTYLVGVPSG
jgi:SAM-dependent methyltransferase